ncbi:hypothetical protein L7F22_038096 [Adiantum nelumboides]|nr:hypothetical protein [Adiantum nelumboides]
MLINHAGELETEEPVTITEFDVLDTLESIFEELRGSTNIKAFLLIALLKLSSRYESCTGKANEIIKRYKHCSTLELQQRAVEFDALLSKHFNSRKTLVERIPVLNETVYESKRADAAVAALGHKVRIASPPLFTSKDSVSSKVCAESTNVDLVNLLDLNAERVNATSHYNKVNVLQDLLDMDTKSSKSPPDAGASNANKEGGNNPLAPVDNEQYAEYYSAQGLSSSPLFPTVVVLHTSCLKVLFNFTKPAHNPKITVINATYLNTSSDLCTDFMLQAAVPKFLLLKLDPASGNVLLPNANGTITQCLTVTNTLRGQVRKYHSLSLIVVFSI